MTHGPTTETRAEAMERPNSGTHARGDTGGTAEEGQSLRGRDGEGAGLFGSPENVSKVRLQKALTVCLGRRR